MKKMTLSVLCICLSMATAAWAQHDGDGGMEMHECPEYSVPSPILTVADLDGDGVVKMQDIKLLWRTLKNRRYEAIMDRDADGRLDIFDLLVALFEYGDRSSRFDRQLVALWNATKRYHDVENAIADGYRPFTQIIHGHGRHYLRIPVMYNAAGELDPAYENTLDEHLEITRPEGLNYDPAGNLIAVFYYHGINVREALFAEDKTPYIAQAMGMVYNATMPELYASVDEMWHHHYGACVVGVDYEAMSLDPTIVPTFYQNLTPAECREYAVEAQGTQDPKYTWNPAFNMIHVWLYKLNPCGIFGNTDPEVAVGYPEETFEFPFDVWYEKMFGMP